MAQVFKVNCQRLATSPSAIAPIKQVTVIGGGLMGSGITQIAAQSGQKVTLVEVKEDLLMEAQKKIKADLLRRSNKIYKDDLVKQHDFVNFTLSNISYSVKILDAVKSAELVIEAIPEKLSLKQSLFANIDKVAPEHAIFASNTSSLLIADIASVTNRKDRFAGLHFFYPVTVMKLLEVVRTKETSQDTHERLMEWGSAIGKTSIACKDTSGFIVNRLLVTLEAEAVRMVERGIATKEEVDTAIKLGIGCHRGPFELADYVGLDTLKFVLDGWHEKYPDVEYFKPVKTLSKLVDEGKLGMKSGEGFYKYNK